MEKVIREAIDKLLDYVISMTGQTKVDALNTCEVEQIQSFIKRALKMR